MKPQALIQLNNVNKVYKMYSKPGDRLAEVFNPFAKKRHHDFYALRDVNLSIYSGEAIGLIGKNGSGKSTLLKIIAGIVSPTSGRAAIRGRVSALLELGAGFNPELTGLENVFFQGALNGFTRSQVEDQLDDILGFADIGDFVRMPVKTYSSGMFVRLAFAVATSIQPEVLIIDEALSVGDMFFQAKSMLRMKKMLEAATTVIFVSHDLGSLKSLCKRGILLEQGQIKFDGEISQAAERYFNSAYSNPSTKSEVHQSQLTDRPFDKTKHFMRITSGALEVTDVVTQNVDGQEASHFEFNDVIQIKVKVQLKSAREDVKFGFHVRDPSGLDIFYSDDSIIGSPFPRVDPGTLIGITFSFRLPITAGDYSVSVVFSSPIDAERGLYEFHDFIPIAAQFKVAKRKPTQIYGKVSPPVTCRIEELSDPAKTTYKGIDRGQLDK